MDRFPYYDLRKGNFRIEKKGMTNNLILKDELKDLFAD